MASGDDVEDEGDEEDGEGVESVVDVRDVEPRLSWRLLRSGGILEAKWSAVVTD